MSLVSVRLSAFAFVLAMPALAAAEAPKLLTKVVPSTHKASEVLTNQTLYVNPCVGGCMVTPGIDNATTSTSSIAQKAANMQAGAWMTGEWQQILQCVQEVYSPYALTVTDQPPTGEYNMIIVGGSEADLGLNAPGAGGIAIVSPDCTPHTNSIAFAFVDTIDAFAAEDDNNRVWGMCWVIAQESAHLYGLDHEYEFTSTMRSACNDPMTYRSDCGGQKFYRNQSASCGEFGPARPGCGPTNTCSSTQNSHQKLLDTLGAGTSTIPAPTVSITLPAAGAVAKGFAVQAAAGSQRGVDHVDLYLNGFKWQTAVGAPFGLAGQQNPSNYALVEPNNVPDGVIDIVVKAYDDLGIETDSATVTVTQGSPCASAASCLTGQKCDAGKCYWDPAMGQIGATCTYDQFCVSGMCQGTSSEKICTQNCVVGSTGTCPMGLDCVDTGGSSGICFPPASGGGCCSASNTRGPWVHLGLGALVLALVMRRRRRR